jgi:hypothetical protein
MNFNNTVLEILEVNAHFIFWRFRYYNTPGAVNKSEVEWENDKDIFFTIKGEKYYLKNFVRKGYQG